MRIRSFNRSDVTQVANIALAAFAKDELYNFVYPKLHQHPYDFQRYQNIKLRKRLVQPGCHGFVAVTDEDEVMGYAFFQRVAGPNPAKDRKAGIWIRDSWFDKLERYLLSCEDSYHDLFDKAIDQNHVSQYTKESSSTYSFYKDIAPYWHVSILAVDPQYQRRGVGTLLVREGQRLALLDNVPLILESSVAAKRLYKKNGFSVLWEGKLCGMVDVAMIWHPGVETPSQDQEEEASRQIEQ